MNYTQSQSHGFIIQDDIKQKVFKIPITSNDINKYDIPKELNIFDSNENISIKVTGTNNIDCGDILRFYSIEDKVKVTIILIMYEQVGNTKKIIKIIEIDYNDELKKILFGTITYDELNQYVLQVKSILPGKVSNKKYIEDKNELQKKHNMYINISPKVDSKSQRRVQCSIPNINNLFKSYPQFIKYQSLLPIIRNVNIIKEFVSIKRIRKHK